MIKYQTETVQEVQEGIKAQFDYHKRDIRDYTPEELEVDWKAYLTLESVGALCVVTARDEGKLVGYIAFVLNNHLHHKNSLWACSTITYVHPGYRRKNIGGAMITESETFLRELSVHTMTVAVTKTADYSRMLKRNDFRFMETTYGKEL